MRLLEYGEVSVSEKHKNMSWGYLSATPDFPPQVRKEAVEYYKKFQPSKLFQKLLDHPKSGFNTCSDVILYNFLASEDNKGNEEDPLSSIHEEFSPGSAMTGITLDTHRQLSRILELLDGDIEGKTVLNLGCGSRGKTVEAKTFNNDARFFPWLSRVLHKLGAKSIGVDIGDLTGEIFEAHRLNLLKEGALNIVPSTSVDLVNCYRLFNSPQLFKMVTPQVNWSCKPGETLARVILPQIKRILKPDSPCIYYVSLDEVGISTYDPALSKWPFHTIDIQKI